MKCKFCGAEVKLGERCQYAAGSRNKVYGWEITAVKEYPRTVTLEELGMKRAPQSWQYMR